MQMTIRIRHKNAYLRQVFAAWASHQWPDAEVVTEGGPAHLEAVDDEGKPVDDVAQALRTQLEYFQRQPIHYWIPPRMCTRIIPDHSAPWWPTP